MYVTPASGSYKVGDSFTVSIRVNTTDQINAVGARLAYGESLQFVSIDAAGTAFGVDATSTGGGGTVSIDRATITPVSGDQLLAKINFKAVASGSGSVQVLNDSEALSNATNQNVITERNGAIFTVAAAASGVTSIPTTNTPATPTTPATVTKTNNSKTTIAPQGNSTPSPLPGDSVIELSAPATIETTDGDVGEISKVEYYLNKKLVHTDTAPPYSYSVDTTNLANGTYALGTKTFYKDGKTTMSTSSLVVNNAFGAKQLWLQLKRYAWVVALLIIAAGGLLYLKLLRGQGKSFFSKNDRGSGTIATSGHGAIVIGGQSSATIAPTPPQDISKQ
jgi:hypothetical protein